MTTPPPVRTRVAPSPTGDPHIGTLYTALFNYAFARRHGGQFLLRIEDTDQARSSARSEQAILDALRWAGIAYDEGPDIGGPCGPYRQSERLAIYQEHCGRLVAAGHAFPCFCTEERLTQLRLTQMQTQAPLGYDGHCFQIPPDEARARVARGESHVMRLKVPREGECVVRDRLRGEIRIPWINVDHQVLLKSDGFPTYHLANVVDDHLMKISHVIRGEEWISSAPKHLLLYQCFGWEPPELIHQPLLRNPDQSKLSKRKNPTGVFYYRQAGILPEALVNFLALMSYAPPEGGDLFSVEDWIREFDIDRISLGGPVFDLQKLTWLNGRYLRERLSVAELLARLKDWRLNDETWMRVLPLVQPRVEKLADVVPMASFLFADRVAYDAAALIQKPLAGDDVARLLRIVIWELEKLRAWDKDTLKECFARAGEIEKLKMRDLLHPFFVALSGSPVSLPLFDSLEILGSDMTRRRLHYALEALAAAGFELKGKKLKRVEDEYRESYR